MSLPAFICAVTVQVFVVLHGSQFLITPGVLLNFTHSIGLPWFQLPLLHLVDYLELHNGAWHETLFVYIFVACSGV